MPLDIAVAGAGPGGLSAALALHRLGHRVVVFEQFTEPKPLGSGLILQPTGLGVLDWLGLGDEMRSLGARIDKLTGTNAASGRTVLDVRYNVLGEARGYAVHRAALFQVLHQAVLKAQIPIETSSEIKGFEQGILVLDKDRRSAKFDLVVDALGAKSPLRRYCSANTPEKPLSYGAVWSSLPWPGDPFDAHALTQRYHNASVMIGVLPIGRVTPKGIQQAAFFWSLKQADVVEWKAKGIDVWKQDVLRYWPEVAPLLQHVQHTDDLTVARYQHHTVSKPYGDRLISIGDSAHSTSPQLGQGANNALLDVLAMTLALQETSGLAEAAECYAKSRRRHVVMYQLLSQVFTPFYQSDTTLLPWLRDTMVAQGARIPVVQRILARTVAGTLVRPIGAPLRF